MAGILGIFLFSGKKYFPSRIIAGRFILYRRICSSFFGLGQYAYFRYLDFLSIFKKILFSLSSTAGKRKYSLAARQKTHEIMDRFLEVLSREQITHSGRTIRDSKPDSDYRILNNMSSKQPRIYFFGIETWEKVFLTERIKKIKNITLVEGKLTSRNVKRFADAEIISVFVHSKVDKKILDHLPKLKFITTRSTGFDHIDLNECEIRGIQVANVPTYGENTVAEHTFALILALSRKVFHAYERVRRLDFDIHGLRGFEIKGKTLGLIGAGHIGLRVARIARGFEMKVIVFDVRQDKNLARRMKFTYVKSIKKLLSLSDVISLHAPYNQATRHIINKENIKYIKKGALLINTARGGLVDTQALLQALDKKIISGAGLDVLEEECVISEECELFSHRVPQECDMATILENHILIARDNVIVTPHIAFNSQEAVERILDTTVENIKEYIRQRPVNIVHFKKK